MNNEKSLKYDKKSSLSPAMILPLVLCCALFSYLTPYAVELSFFISFVLCAYLIASRVNPLWFIIFLIPPAVWFVMSGNMLYPAFSVIYILPSVFAGTAMKRGGGFTKAVIYSVLGMCAVGVVILTFVTVTVYSGNPGNLIKAISEFFREQGLKFAEQTMVSLEKSGYKNVALNIGELEKSSVRLVFFLPSAVILIFEVISYAGLKIIGLISLFFRNKEKLGLVSWGITVDLSTACVFMLSILLTFFRTSDKSVVYIVALNMFIILMPFFFVIGVRRFFVSLKNPAFGCIRMPVLILLVFMIFQPVIIIYIAALSGAVGTITDAYRNYRKK